VNEVEENSRTRNSSSAAILTHGTSSLIRRDGDGEVLLVL
jgi:hypothetical protein